MASSSLEHESRTDARVDLNRVDLNLLVALDALLTEQSVTRAAQRLSLGQSAMSATLGRLRRLLDDPVLVRTGRTLTATPFAASLAAPTRAALAQIEELLGQRHAFDPASAQRTFTVLASDYVTVVFLTPFLAHLAELAPGIRLRVSPPGDDYVERLRQGRSELAIMPREAFTSYREFSHVPLFDDTFVVAVDAGNPVVGTTISREEFSSLPYLATSCGHQVSPVESQLDAMGIVRNTELTTAFGLAPLLLRETGMIALIHARMASAMADKATLRLLDPPVPLQPIHELLLWPDHCDGDPAHEWLRDSLSAAAAALPDQFHTEPVHARHDN